VTGRWRPEWVSDCDLVVASPGFPEGSEPIRDSLAAGRPVGGEVELACRQLRTEMIAITGTNGKTTVARLTGEMLARSGMEVPVVGNIGSPISDLVGTGASRAVVELSSFQLRFTETLSPRVAVIINVAPDHLDIHRDLVSYETSKARLWRWLPPGATAVANRLDPTVMAHLPEDRAAWTFAHRGPADWWCRAGTLTGPSGPVVSVRELRRAMPHDLANALAAAATATAVGATTEGLAEALRTFEPGSHRVQLVASIGGVSFYDDSKATTPHATVAALRGFGTAVLIAGGRNKGLDLSELLQRQVELHNDLNRVQLARSRPPLYTAAPA